MAKKDFTLTGKILVSLLLAGDMVLVTPRELRRRAWKGQLLGDQKYLTQTIHYLVKKGWIKYANNNSQRFLKLTRNGELEALLAKACLPPESGKWDGKWRVVIFDIPEECKSKRHFFRWLLKKNGFIKLQHSVYISPYPLNREALRFLNKTGLIEYIRILKVEEMDNDKDLKKIFKLAV